MKHLKKTSVMILTIVAILFFAGCKDETQPQQPQQWPTESDSQKKSEDSATQNNVLQEQQDNQTNWPEN